MHAGCIDGDRLLREDVLSRHDRGLKMHWPEVRRRAQQDDVHAALQELLVRVKPHEAAVGGDSDLRPRLLVLFQMAQALLQPILEGVGHGDELDAGIGGKCLSRRAGAAIAAADQPDPQEVAPARVNQRQAGDCAGDDRTLQERAPGS